MNATIIPLNDIQRIDINFECNNKSELEKETKHYMYYLELTANKCIVENYISIPWIKERGCEYFKHLNLFVRRSSAYDLQTGDLMYKISVQLGKE